MWFHVAIPPSTCTVSVCSATEGPPTCTVSVCSATEGPPSTCTVSVCLTTEGPPSFSLCSTAFFSILGTLKLGCTVFTDKTTPFPKLYVSLTVEVPPSHLSSSSRVFWNQNIYTVSPLTCSNIVCTCYLLLFTTFFIPIIINNHVWPFNTCVSTNNTLIQDHNLFRNNTPTQRAIQPFTSKHQYTTLISINSTQILSGHHLINQGIILWKLLSMHKISRKLSVKIISNAHKYFTTYHGEGTHSLHRN